MGSKAWRGGRRGGFMALANEVLFSDDNVTTGTSVAGFEGRHGLRGGGFMVLANEVLFSDDDVTTGTLENIYNKIKQGHPIIYKCM